MNNATGYFGRAGGSDGKAVATKVHYIKPNGKVACGYKPHKTFQFQFCAHGINYPYIECKGCRAWVRDIEQSRKDQGIEKEKEKAMKVKLSGVEKDVVLVLPDGREIEVQYRNYEGDKKTGEGATVDFILPSPHPVYNFLGSDLKPSKKAKGFRKATNVLEADQLTIVL